MILTSFSLAACRHFDAFLRLPLFSRHFSLFFMPTLPLMID